MTNPFTIEDLLAIRTQTEKFLNAPKAMKMNSDTVAVIKQHAVVAKDKDVCLPNPFGIEIVIDEEMPAGEVKVVNVNGEVIRIFNLLKER